MDLKCYSYVHALENITDVLFTCPHAQEFWEASGIPAIHRRFSPSYISHNFRYLINLINNLAIPENLRILIPWLLWDI